MIKRTHSIIKSAILLWIILFGVVSNHSECKSAISDICHSRTSIFSVEQVSVIAAHTFELKSITECNSCECGQEQESKEEKTVFVSGQYPNKIKQIWGIETNLILKNDKVKTFFGGFVQNKIPKSSAIYILTQSFLC